MHVGQSSRLSRRQLIGRFSVFGSALGVLQVVACSPAAPAQPAAPPTVAAAPTTPPAPTAAKPAATTAPPPTVAPAPTAAPAATTAPAATAAPTPSGAAAAGTPKRGGTLSLLVHEDLTSLDPHVETSLGDTLMLPMLVEPLVAGNAKDDIEPVLAESWKSDAAGKSWTFNIRKGVMFHNGRELTADDVKWNFDRIQDPKNTALQGPDFKNRGLTISVVDKYTIKMDITSGAGAFLSNLTVSVRAGIMAPESVGSDGKIANLIGTGPFKLVEWKPGASVRFASHTGFWQKGADGKPLPYIDGVNVTIAPDATSRLNSLLANQVDFITQPPNNEIKKWVDGKPPAGVAFQKWFYNYSDFLILNYQRPPFMDVKVRQAVRLTIDRDAVNDLVYEGLGEVHNQPFKKSSRWYENIPIVKPDLAQAKQLMKDAGLESGVDVVMPVWAPAFQKHAEAYQAQVAQIGIRAKIEQNDVGSWVKRVSTWDWDMSPSVVGTLFHPDRPYGYFATDHPERYFFAAVPSAELDGLIVQGRNELDVDKAKAIYTTIQQKYAEDQGVPQFIVNQPLIHAYRDYVQGYGAYGMDFVSLNAAMGLHRTWLAK